MNEYTLDLKNLLRLSFSQPLTWLAGEPGEDIPVHWATTSDEEVLTGDILLLPAGKMSAEDELIMAGTHLDIAIE